MFMHHINPLCSAELTIIFITVHAPKMSASSSATFLLVFNLSLLLFAVDASNEDLEAIRTARSGVLRAMEWAQSLHELHESSRDSGHAAAAMRDCATLYGDAEERLARLDISPAGDSYDHDDAVTWLSAAMSSHRSCLDGLDEKGLVSHRQASQNLTFSLKQALARYARKRNIKNTRNVMHKKLPSSSESGGLLESWSAASSKAHIVVAQDGSGNYKTINEAVSALSRMGNGGGQRVVVYVKAGVYNEIVEIQQGMKNVMLVGDGMDRTIITGNRNVQDGSTTFGSATFRVSGDGFWARDVTFENTAGPQKHQAVALAVASDHAVFYRCGMKAYQDTLFVHSLRQFYRDCHIHGTIDFIFGNAAAVLQNCDIFVKKPMDHQANMITAQGRDDPNENTGISILNSRVIPTPELGGGVKSYLGRPWRKYSRTVFIKTDLDGLIDPKGWFEWSGDFALSTLYYGEYMNTGAGASTQNRVNWSGFHVLSRPEEASPFCVKNFIQGDSWIPESGVPFGSEI